MKVSIRAPYWAFAAALSGCAMFPLNSNEGPGAAGPADQGPALVQPTGDARPGKDVFRFETFGNEGFWTHAARLPQGILAAQVTPIQALQPGLNVDVLKVPLDIALRVVFDLLRDPTLQSSEVMHDPEITPRLMNANAVIGVVVKGPDGKGHGEIRTDGLMGPTCALCHTDVKGALFRLKDGGGISFRKPLPELRRDRDGKANQYSCAASTWITAPIARPGWTACPWTW